MPFVAGHFRYKTNEFCHVQKFLNYAHRELNLLELPVDEDFCNLQSDQLQITIQQPSVLQFPEEKSAARAAVLNVDVGQNARSSFF